MLLICTATVKTQVELVDKRFYAQFLNSSYILNIAIIPFYWKRFCLDLFFNFFFSSWLIFIFCILCVCESCKFFPFLTSCFSNILIFRDSDLIFDLITHLKFLKCSGILWNMRIDFHLSELICHSKENVQMLFHLHLFIYIHCSIYLNKRCFNRVAFFSSLLHS